jgi:two-component system sensor histidine kinase DesK
MRRTESNDPWSRISTGNYPFGPGRTGYRRWLGPMIGLLWLAIPFADFFGGGPSPTHIVFVTAAVPAFAYLYLARVGKVEDMRANAVSLAGMLAAGTVLTVAVDPAWAVLFCYSTVAAGLWLPERVNAFAVLAITGLAAGALVVAGAEGGAILGIAGACFAVGSVFLLVSALVRANRALEETRAELAELAVADERLRFSRDLHDLLGHDLSLIALKSELAGRLLPGEVERAGREVDEIKVLTRDALARVREAVGGYRRPTLASELAGARVAMEAAGIKLSVDGEPEQLAPDAESVLAWAVREGATNVIRHSAAENVAITVRPGTRTAELEIADDGTGAPVAAAGGHGLDGLRERARAVGGRIDAAGVPGGGFRLRVTVPADGGEAV